MFACAYIYAGICINVCMYMYPYVRIYSCAYIYTGVCICTCMCMYPYIKICLCACMYMYLGYEIYWQYRSLRRKLFLILLRKIFWRTNNENLNAYVWKSIYLTILRPMYLYLLTGFVVCAATIYHICRATYSYAIECCFIVNISNEWFLIVVLIPIILIFFINIDSHEKLFRR